MDELLLIGAAIAATMIVLPWLIFALASLFEGFPRLRIGQVLGMIGVAAWIFGYIASLGPSGGTEILLVGTIAAILLAFAGMWTREFRLLMLRRSDEFPDRPDKVSWTLVLTLMAPAGVWLFRSYRKARWPEVAEAAGPHPLDEPAPGPEAPGMQRIGA